MWRAIFFLFRSEMTNNRKWEEQGQFVYSCLSKAVNSRRKTPRCWPSTVAAELEHHGHFSALLGHIHIQEIYTTSRSKNKANSYLYSPGTKWSLLWSAYKLFITHKGNYVIKSWATSYKILFQHSSQKNLAFQQEFTDLGGKYVV